MEISSRQIRELNVALHRHANATKGPKFVHAIARNILVLKPLIAALQTAQLASAPDHKKYNEQRLEMCKEYSDKDEGGNPKMIPMGPQSGAFHIVKQKKEFDVAVGALQIKYKKAIEIETKRLKEFEEMLDVDTEEVTPYTIPLSYIPKSKAKEGDDDELLVNAIDLMTFMEYGIVIEDPVSEVPVPPTPIRTAKKKKK